MIFIIKNLIYFCQNNVYVLPVVNMGCATKILTSVFYDGIEITTQQEARMSLVFFFTTEDEDIGSVDVDMQ